MKLKKYLDLKEDHHSYMDEEDDYDEEEDKLDGYEIVDQNEYDGDEEDYEDDQNDDISEDDMSHLLYLLRSYFSNSGIDADIENDDLDIKIFYYPNKKEKIRSILGLFDVVKRLKKDILPQYNSEFEVWETKTGDSVLVFNFEYDNGDGDDKIPF